MTEERIKKVEGEHWYLLNYNGAILTVPHLRSVRALLMTVSPRPLDAHNEFGDDSIVLPHLKVNSPEVPSYTMIPLAEFYSVSLNNSFGKFDLSCVIGNRQFVAICE